MRPPSDRNPVVAIVGCAVSVVRIVLNHILFARPLMLFSRGANIAVFVILGARTDDVNGSTCANPVEQLVGRGAKRPGRMDEAFAREMLDKRCARFPDLLPWLNRCSAQDASSAWRDRHNRKSSEPMLGRNSSAPIASPAMRATMPLFDMPRRHDRTSMRTERTATRSVS